MPVMSLNVEIVARASALHPEDPDQVLVMRTIRDNSNDIELIIGGTTVVVSILEMLAAVDILNRAAGGDC